MCGYVQPRPQGLLAFQYGGGRREDPGTQQKSRDWFVLGEWKFIQNGGKGEGGGGSEKFLVHEFWIN